MFSPTITVFTLVTLIEFALAASLSTYPNPDNVSLLLAPLVVGVIGTHIDLGILQTCQVTGDINGVHDPSMCKVNGTYYLYGTGSGIGIRISTDRVHWTVSPLVHAKA